MKIEIKDTRNIVIYLTEANSIKEAVEEAITRYSDLAYADLRYANLRNANLRNANLRCANLRNADLEDANLSYADLEDANLEGAILVGAIFVDADLRYANLEYTNLEGANLRGANLRYANLTNANLSYVDLRNTNLEGANFTGVNLSQTKGLLNSADWLKQNFKFDKRGRLIVYKAFGDTYYSSPSNWKIKTNQVITEIVNSCRTSSCGCGVNFATKKWIRKVYEDKVDIEIRQCYIKPIDFVDIVVPYNTDGKARCERLIIGRKVKV